MTEPIIEQCKKCKGTGKVGKRREPCPYCKGTGKFTRQAPADDE